jgi:hypothetical protein
MSISIPVLIGEVLAKEITVEIIKRSFKRYRHGKVSELNETNDDFKEILISKLNQVKEKMMMLNRHLLELGKGDKLSFNKSLIDEVDIFINRINSDLTQFQKILPPERLEYLMRVDATIIKKLDDIASSLDVIIHSRLGEDAGYIDMKKMLSDINIIKNIKKAYEERNIFLVNPVSQRMSHQESGESEESVDRCLLDFFSLFRSDSLDLTELGFSNAKKKVRHEKHTGTCSVEIAEGILKKRRLLIECIKAGPEYRKSVNEFTQKMIEKNRSGCLVMVFSEMDSDRRSFAESFNNSHVSLYFYDSGQRELVFNNRNDVAKKNSVLFDLDA